VNAPASTRIEPGWNMNLPHSARILLAAALALDLSACASSSSSPAPPADAARAGVTREMAVNTARSDAAVHFQAPSVSHVAAQPMGTYWLVELRTPSGEGLRYAISRQDGSIRQRSSFQ